MFEQLEKSKRLLMEGELTPAQGYRFQPTGFPDLGGATYQLHDGTRMLLVESAQSMANRMEAALLGPANELKEEFAGLPYIRVRLTGGTDTTTNSLIEAHRINSPFIISDENFQEMFKQEAGYGPNKPLNWRKIAAALFKYDVNSLIHGVFLANIGDGRIKVPRMISAFIEARDVKDVISGGVKNNSIDPTGKLRVETYKKDVYGNVPYQRIEYTADKITAFFNMDIGMLRSYDLGMDASELIIALSLYKIRFFLEEGTRLRTACDFKIKGDSHVTEPHDFTVPTSQELLAQIKEKIKKCQNLFANPPITELVSKVAIVKAKETEESEAAED